MKKLTQLFFLGLLTFLGLAASRTEARACVDYHNDSVNVIVHYESNYTDVSITLSNLQLFGGSPNQFCSCAVNSITNVFTNILYVAFVDSGTINPVPGFDVWDASANATNAWAGVVSTGNWNGFVSMVNQNGLTPGGPVELIVRARLPVGYYYSFLDSAVREMQFGTDEWFNGPQTLGNTHQSISGVEPNITYFLEPQGSNYWATLDAALMVGRRDPMNVEAGISLYPVPATDRLYVELKARDASLQRVEVYDVAGRVLLAQDAVAGTRLGLDLSAIDSGAYFVKVFSSKGTYTRRFMKVN